MADAGYEAWLEELTAWYARGVKLPLSPPEGQTPPSPAADAPLALVFAPHPDDEVIIGGLPLRMLREAGMRVTNVAVTQGSNQARQAARLVELRGCCARIGFGLISLPDHGLERVRPNTRREDPDHWERAVERIAEILRRERPACVFFPHDNDWNSTHIGTQWLVRDALDRMDLPFECLTFETEFWGAMADPNLMVESAVGDVARLIEALTFHEGEVRRNPYHLRLAAWMMDNVRRGGELVGGQGGAAPDFLFATLYRARRWRDGAWTALWTGGRFLSAQESLQSLWS
jgi:LmbE family N-acetylglucosaminyl deacetylase